MNVKISKYILTLLLFVCVCKSFADASPEQPTGTMLILGDSLSAAYGLPTEQGWVALLRQHWQSKYPDVKVVNVSVSGATTADGLHTLSSHLKRHQPSWIVIELGGNDGLQGKPIIYIRKNLDKLITIARQHGHVFLVGMRLPPNLGPRYTEPFYQLFQQLSKQYGTGYDAFLLDGVAKNEEFMQADGIHPNAAGQKVISQRVAPLLEAWLTTSTRQDENPAE